MYIRKTRDEYELQIDYGYGYGFETVLTEDSRKEARARYNEYLANDMFLKQIRIVKKRVKL
jgi:hypothetical protein